jgi:hypothetical protein
MTDAHIQLQNALTTTFLANLAFLSEYDNELYHRVDELSRLIEQGNYKEKYALEFILENGDFDIYDIVNNKYLYKKEPRKINNKLINNVHFNEKNSIFNIEEPFLIENTPTLNLEKRFDYENSFEFLNFVVNNMSEYSNCLNDFLKNRNKKLKEIKKFIFLGTLLGRHIPKIAEKIDAEMYLVLERNLEIFRLSLFTVDYTILAKKGVIFSVMDDDLKLEKKIFQFFNINIFDNYLIKFSTTNINIEKYVDHILSTLLLTKPTYYSYSRRLYSYVNRTTKVIKKGYKILLFNKIKEKCNFFKNLSVLYIAAGPSLDENIDWVKNNQDKFFIVTVGSALKKLLDNDIRVDMVTSLDEQYEILYYKQFSDENIKRLNKNTIILASTITNEKVLKKFNQENLFLYEIYNPFLKDNLAFNGYSIGEVTVDLLLKMNVKEMYLLGLDLALNQKTGETHAKGSNSGINIINLDEIEGREVFKLNNSKIKVKGNLEEEVFTTSVLYNSIKYLEKILSANDIETDIKLYNLSIHGAYIDGTRPKKVNEINTNEIKRINNNNIDIIKFFTNNAISHLDKSFKEVLQKDIKIVEDYLHIALIEIRNKKFKTYDDFLQIILESEQKYESSNIYWIMRNYFGILIPYLSYHFNEINIKKEEEKVNKIKEIFIKQIELILNDYIYCLERIKD